MTRIALLSNARSGSSDEGGLAAIEETLKTLGSVTSVAPESLEEFGPAVRLAAEGCDLLVVAGGDGTFNRALNELEGHLGRIVLGLIPMGTGNDLARTLGLPPDPADAARALVSGEERSLDVSRAAGPGISRLFANACMGGFPIEVNEAIGDDLKKRLGPFAFWVGGARAAADITRYEVTLGDSVLAECVACGVGNGRTCGGGIEVWPEADPADGVLDGCGLAAEGLTDALKLAARVKSGEHVDLPGVLTIRGPKIEIVSDPQMEFNVDGELVGLKTPATFEVVGRMKMRVPAS